MKRSSLAFVAIIAFISAFKMNSFKGIYIYAGSYFNGKYEPASTDYSLQRKYDDKTFDAFLFEDKQPPYKYQSGNYQLNGDTCLETETFNTQSAFLTNKTIHYYYSFNKDTLILKGILPNGKPAEEHWVKKK